MTQKEFSRVCGRGHLQGLHALCFLNALYILHYCLKFLVMLETRKMRNTVQLPYHASLKGYVQYESKNMSHSSAEHGAVTYGETLDTTRKGLKLCL